MCIDPEWHLIHITRLGDEGRTRIDCIDLTRATTPVNHPTWGRLKSLYETAR
ncbi:MAG: hypothetical protein GF355_04510 [Candidatus Eisenbacteria bacterium]|nr:hypothetical protein [Candidatus Eisenbacteria bacterium]